MAYEAAHALQGFYGIKDDSSFDPAAGLVPLTSSLIPPLVAQAFGLPSLSSAPPPPPQTLQLSQHQPSLYGQGINPALLGALGFGGAQYAAALQQQSQLAGLPLGYLQALAAASQHHHQQQQYHQQQQQQSAAAFLAQTAGALQAHTAALAAAARSTTTTSSVVSQPIKPAPSVEVPSARSAPTEPERSATTSGATNSSALKAAQAARNSSGNPTPFQNPFIHSLYAALSQQHTVYNANPATSYAAALGPYATSHHLQSAYYARPPEGNPSAAAAVAAAAAAATTGAYGYQHLPASVSYGNSFHSGYGAAPPLEYSALAAAAAYRPLPSSLSLPAPSSNPQQSASLGGGEEDYADDGTTRAIKRPRLVWTPQLHKKFETAVSKLGVDKAVPKNIMQEMNIDGLTRENVASHLQKYRMLRRKDNASTTSTISEGRDSDTRTAGSKRSEPDSVRAGAPPAPPAATPATLSLAGPVGQVIVASTTTATGTTPLASGGVSAAADTARPTGPLSAPTADVSVQA